MSAPGGGRGYAAGLHRGLGGPLGLLRDPTFLLVGLFTFTVFATRSGSRMTLLPLITDERFAMSGTQLGLLFSVIATVNFVLVAPGGWLSDRFGRKRVMVPGILLSAIALLLFAWSGSVQAIFAAAVVIGIGLVTNAVFIGVVATLLTFVARETRRAPRAS